jgi:hypothetical protein
MAGTGTLLQSDASLGLAKHAFPDVIIAAQSTSWLRFMGDASEASKKIWQMYSSVLAAYPSNQSKKWPVLLPTIEYSEGLAKPWVCFTLVMVCFTCATLGLRQNLL